MPAFYVRRKEVHHQMVSIEADTPEQARELVNDGGGEDFGDSEYAHTLDEDQMEVYDANEKQIL